MIDLTLYGKPSSIYQYLKLNVKAFADKVGIDVSIKEIHDTDAFILESIVSIPAVKLGGEVKSIDKKNINTFINQINQWIYSKVEKNNLLTVNVPTDFSDTSINAVDYAKEITKKLNGILNLIHCYYPTPVTVSDFTYIDPDQEVIRRENFEEFANQIISDSYLEDARSPMIEKEFVLGFPAKEIVQISKRTPNSLIVIGSSGVGKLKKYFGSVSIEVVQKSECPVLVVPPAASYKPLRKITLCSNDIDLDAAIVDEIIKIATPYNAEIEVLHVDEGKGYQETLLMNMLTKQYPKNKVGFTLIQGEDKLAAIESYSKTEKPDLLVFTRKSRNLLKDLFHKSFTKSMLLTSDIPLLIIHK